MTGSEQLFESAAVAVVRLNGTPRQVGSGRHRRLIAYAAADASTAEIVWLLRETAERLARTLPRFEDA